MRELMRIVVYQGSEVEEMGRGRRKVLDVSRAESGLCFRHNQSRDQRGHVGFKTCVMPSNIARI